MKHEKLLKNMIGNTGFETLSKVIERKKTSNVADPLELYLPLLVVPRTILSWLVQNIRPIKVDETKTLDFPGDKKIKIEIRKLDTDVYAGEFIENGKIIHSFNRQTLPSLGGHLMTVGELYDDIVDDEKIGTSVNKLIELMEEEKKDRKKESKKEKKEESEEEPEKEEEKQEHKMIDQSADHLVAMTSIVGKLIDALVANHLTPKEEKKEETEKGEIKAQVLKEPLKEHVIDRTHIPKVTKDELMEKAGFNKPGGSAQPMKPKMPVPPVPPGAAPGAMGLAARQTQAAARGRSTTATPGAAKKPSIAQNKIAQPKPAQPKLGVATQKPQTMKEDPLDRTPNKRSHLLRKLKRTQKSESIRYGVSAQEMQSKCIHCGVAEFTKNEKNDYKFTPCHCFTVMQKSENGRKAWFVKISKSESGFNLHFNPKTDPESIRAFLLTLKNTIKNRS